MKHTPIALVLAAFGLALPSVRAQSDGYPSLEELRQEVEQVLTTHGAPPTSYYCAFGFLLTSAGPSLSTTSGNPACPTYPAGLALAVAQRAAADGAFPGSTYVGVVEYPALTFSVVRHRQQGPAYLAPVPSAAMTVTGSPTRGGSLHFSVGPAPQGAGGNGIATFAIATRGGGNPLLPRLGLDPGAVVGIVSESAPGAGINLSIPSTLTVTAPFIVQAYYILPRALDPLFFTDQAVVFVY